ncbi:MAG: hypothetical protein IPL88_12540 [Rhizobiales bacterium]|nr:hypothetical protein [Hyphomicrobiales bacterium]
MAATGDAGEAGPRNEGAATGSPVEDGATDREPAPIDPRLDRLIGQSLEAHYEDILSAPLPDRFLVLLAQLEASEQKA